MHETLPQRMRRIIRKMFLELGGPCPTAPRETLLIRHGNYCGHRFENGELHAVWFIEENQVKFYGADGCVIKSLTPPNQNSGGEQRAA